jgi:hypothetical protein
MSEGIVFCMAAAFCLQGMWQELETVPGLRQAVASLLVDGTAVLFEPQGTTAEQMLPPRQVRLCGGCKLCNCCAFCSSDCQQAPLCNNLGSWALWLQHRC